MRIIILLLFIFILTQLSLLIMYSENHSWLTCSVSEHGWIGNIVLCGIICTFKHSSGLCSNIFL